MKYHLETRDAEVLIDQLVKLFARRMDNCHMSASIGTQKSRAQAKAREATYADVIETLQNIVLPAKEGITNSVTENH